MKKILLTIFMLTCLILSVQAGGGEDALSFFKNYVNAANTYSNTITEMYSPTAKIIRQVVKTDGTTANAYTDTATYIKQMKIGQAGAKLRHYTNSYSNYTVTEIIPNKKYKISALRQPAGETYKLKMYQVIEKQSNGKWLIVEEMMQTKQQIFLKYAE